jgi:hypothetical protein
VTSDWNIEPPDLLLIVVLGMLAVLCFYGG